MDLFNLTGTPPLLVWVIFLLVCSLILWIALMLYLRDLVRARVRRRRFVLSGILLVIVGLWCAKVCLDAWQIYSNYAVLENSFSPDFHMSAEIYLLYRTIANSSFSTPYVLQLYALLFLFVAMVAFLLRHILRLHLTFFYDKNKEAGVQSQQDEQGFEGEQLDGYVVQIAFTDSGKRARRN